MRPARLVVKAAAAACDVLRHPPIGLVVLIYHRVGRRTDVEVDLPLDLFERQMRVLAEECCVVSLDDGLALAASDQSLESSVVAVTFDDGTADFADLAVPVLVRFSIPVTLYVATSFIDAGTDFPDGGRPVSWAGLRDARSTGLVEIGSHTHHHALLDRLPTHAVGSELDDSIESIRRNLGVAPRHFAYPKAILGSPEAEQEVRARFVSAALAGTRPNRLGATDAHRLARSPIQINDGMRWFMKKVRGGLGMEDALRRRAARYRYRGRDT